MSVIEKYHKMFHDAFIGGLPIPKEYLISTEEFDKLQNELQSQSQYSVPYNGINRIFVHFLKDYIVEFKKDTRFDIIITNPRWLEQTKDTFNREFPEYTENHDSICSHQYVNIGFTSEKYVCKLCNQEQV